MARKTYKALLVTVTVICIIAGTIIHFTGRFSFDRIYRSCRRHTETVRTHDEGSRKTAFADSVDNFASIDIDISYADLDVVVGDDYGYSYDGDSSLKPEVTVEDGVLRLRDNSEKHRFRLGSFRSRRADIVITVPSDAVLDEIKIDMNAGDVDIDTIRSRQATININAGDFDADDCNLENISVDTDMGDVDFNNCSFKNMNASLDMGDFSVSPSHSVSDYDIDLSCSLGKVSFYGKGHGTQYSQHGSAGSIKIDCSMGEIKIY